MRLTITRFLINEAGRRRHEKKTPVALRCALALALHGRGYPKAVVGDDHVFPNGSPAWRIALSKSARRVVERFERRNRLKPCVVVLPNLEAP